MTRTFKVWIARNKGRADDKEIYVFYGEPRASISYGRDWYWMGTESETLPKSFGLCGLRPGQKKYVELSLTIKKEPDCDGTKV